MTPLRMEAHAPTCPVAEARWADDSGRDPREAGCTCAKPRWADLFGIDPTWTLPDHDWVTEDDCIRCADCGALKGTPGPCEGAP